MAQEPSDFILKFLDYSPAADTGAPAPPGTDAEAELLDAYFQAVTAVVARGKLSAKDWIW